MKTSFERTKAQALVVTSSTLAHPIHRSWTRLCLNKAIHNGEYNFLYNEQLAEDLNVSPSCS